MRLRILIPATLVVALLAGAGVTAHAAADRHTWFTSAAAALRAQWEQDQAEGVPSAALDPLRHRLQEQQPTADWWSPSWFGNDGQALLTRLQHDTSAAWASALDNRRVAAEAVLASWTGFATDQAQWVDGGAAATAAQWPQQLAAARTPAAIDALITTWNAQLSSLRDQVAAAQAAAQTARLATELRSAGGPQALLTTAHRLLAVASSANLDPGDVADLAAQLQARLDGSGDAIAIADKLLAAVSSLQDLVNLNNTVDAKLRPLLWSIDQAAAERTPSAASFQKQDSVIEAQMRAARTTTELNAVATAVGGLGTQVDAELAANQCGHPVGSGKVITIDLTLQEMLFYQDGCVVRGTPITSGRPQLPTPTGTFHVFYKTSPFTMVSPWPKSSPYYYYPTVVTWVMEFAGGGYFIHDAYWESLGSYGPGGDRNPSAASHGCVHVPTSTMEWAYSWTPNGTLVVISA